MWGFFFRTRYSIWESMALQQESQPTVKSLIETSTWIYGTIGAIGVVMARFGHESLPGIIAWPKDIDVLLRFAAVTISCVGILIILNYFFEEYSQQYRDLRSSLGSLLGHLNSYQIIYLAVISAAGEELFFRAGVQSYLGIFPTSIIFGLLHLGPGGRISLWTIWAMVAGIFLGWLFDGTNSLWPCLVAHCAINVIGLVRLRRMVRETKAHPKSPTPQELRPR